MKRNRSEGGNVEDKFIKVPVNIIDCSDGELGYWLAKFVLKGRKKGSEQRYCGNTLYQLCCGIQLYIRENSRPVLNLFSNPKFK